VDERWLTSEQNAERLKDGVGVGRLQAPAPDPGSLGLYTSRDFGKVVYGVHRQSARTPDAVCSDARHTVAGSKRRPNALMWRPATAMEHLGVTWQLQYRWRSPYLAVSNRRPGS
jgi:hypothetical protein